MIKLKYKPLKKVEITSKYGIRAFGGLEFHSGIDYKGNIDDEIYAVDDGKVVVAKSDEYGYGLYIIIEHSNYCSLYSHLKALEVSIGQVINAGDVIGHIGMTGMTTGAHLHFEIRDSLYNDLFWTKSNLKGRHVMCIDPEDLVKEAEDIPLVRYKKYNNNIHELQGDVKDLNVKVVNKKIWYILEYTNCTNGTFYYYDTKGNTYATSILYADGVTYQDVANHYYTFNAPQSVFIVNKDNSVELRRINFLTEIDLNNVKLVVGGVGLRNTQDINFKYDPAGEGFKKGNRLQDNKLVDYSDVLRKTNKTVLGYNKRLNKVYLLTVKNVTHGELLKIISDDSSGEAYDIAISLDGGGSSFMDANKKYVFQGEGGRVIHNIIGFSL